MNFKVVGNIYCQGGLLNSGFIQQCSRIHTSLFNRGQSRREQFKTVRAKAKRSIYNDHQPQLRRSAKEAYKQSETKVDMLHGHHPVYSALKAQRRHFETLFMRMSVFKLLSEPSDAPALSTSKENITNLEVLKKVWDLANDTQLPIVPVHKSKLDKLCSYGVHQGLVAQCSPLEVPQFSNHSLNRDTFHAPRLWLLIDNVVDPMNIGALIRSAVYFGVDKVILSTNCSKLSPVVSKASSGAMEFANIEIVFDIADCVSAMREADWSIIGTSCDAEKSSNIIEKTKKRDTAVIIGSESRGVDSRTLELCTQLYSIPPDVGCPNYIDSLNVSVASGIILNQLRKT